MPQSRKNHTCANKRGYVCKHLKSFCLLLSRSQSGSIQCSTIKMHINIDSTKCRLVLVSALFFITGSAAQCATKLHTQSDSGQSADDSDALDWAQGKNPHARGRVTHDDDSYVSVPANPIKKPTPQPEKTESKVASSATPTSSAKTVQAKADAEQNDLEQTLKLLKGETNSVDLKTVGDTIISLRRKVTDHPQDAAMRLKLGTYLYVAGDYEGAASELKHALGIKPLDLTAHTLLARVLGEAGEHEASALEFKRAVSIAPGAA